MIPQPKEEKHRFLKKGYYARDVGVSPMTAPAQDAMQQTEVLTKPEFENIRKFSLDVVSMK